MKEYTHLGERETIVNLATLYQISWAPEGIQYDAYYITSSFDDTLITILKIN